MLSLLNLILNTLNLFSVRQDLSLDRNCQGITYQELYNSDSNCNTYAYNRDLLSIKHVHVIIMNK